MPYGARHLVALTLCLGLGLSAAHAAGEQTGGAGSTWIDPPARRTDVAKPDGNGAHPVTPARVSAPRAADLRGQRPSAHREKPARHRIVRRQVSRTAQATPRHRATTAPGPSRLAAMPARRPVFDDRPYPVYRSAQFAPPFEDERLERLSTAVRSGYIVMHRRSVEYPDGRTIRYYRPADDDWDE